MKFNNKVSIVITSYNRLADLKENLNNIKYIKYSNYEVIVVDNGSTDGSREYLENLNNSLFKKIIIPTNKGPAYSHDIGMRSCNGEIIITIDDDCFLQPDVVTHTVEIFNKNPNLAAIGYGFMNPNILFNKKKFKYDYFNINELIDINISYEPIIATSGAAFRKSSLEKINYYDLNWFHVEDWELSLKLIANGFNTIKISSLIAFHKSSPLNRDFESRRLHQIQGVVWIMLKFYPIKYLILNLTIFSFNTLFYFIFYRKFSYLLAFYQSLSSAKRILKNRKVIPTYIFKNMNKPQYTVFA